MTFAYIDEADAQPTIARPGLYLIAAAVVEQHYVARCDELLRYFLREEDIDLKGHARLHLSRIKDRRRKNELVATLGCLRGTRFVVAWLGGYTDTKAREKVRGRRLGSANYLARKSTDLGHALTVLEDSGMVTREPDAFHGKRSAYRIAEPILTFYHAIMRPDWSDLERPGRAYEVWERAQPTFLSKVVGPHFEQVCRTWARWYATPETLGGQRGRVGSGTVSDPVAKTSHEVDVVVFGRDGDGHRPLLAIGEAKWNEAFGGRQLRRLEHIRSLLRARADIDAENTRLLCFSGAGFTDDVRTLAQTSDSVQLIDLERLYHGA